MIDNIRIRNYKSIVDLTLELGRFNVIIGTNGCGKSNILEAIMMASAASQNKLDTEFLMNRNIRVTDPYFMMNAFDDVEIDKTNTAIQIDIKERKSAEIVNAIIGYYDKTKEWINVGNITDKPKIQRIAEQLEASYDEMSIKDQKEFEKYRDVLRMMYKMNPDDLYKLLSEISTHRKGNLSDSSWKNLMDMPYFSRPSYATFLNYRPVEKVMRDMTESPIYPLGIRGEGMFQYLKDLSTNKDNQSFFEGINDGLQMLEWFDGVSVPQNQLSKEYKLSIGDRYLKESLHSFDQRSTNEGFLYLLFFLTLFNSNETPSFFAVDNIETSFNPGLCQSLARYLTGVSKMNEKQVILTTHNPYILDGLDLSDDEQRLFVCRRDVDGHTRIERVKYREDRKMSLSELWMSGLIGALPDNF